MEQFIDCLKVGFPLVFGGFVMAFAVTFFAIPSIVSVAHAKKLYDIPSTRKSHMRATPVLGGIAIFAGLTIASITFSAIEFGSELKYIIAGLIILFFFGIKDDIIALDPKKKLAAEVMTALLISVLGDIRITNLHGFIGIHEINYTFSICLTAFFFIVLTNGFNLIDGIDGLASGIGIIVSITFGCWFIVSAHYSYAVMSFALIGSLLAFFYFNVFSRHNKIFLGDTGSLILGLLISVFAIRFMEFEVKATGMLMVESTPGVTFGILIIPLFDTLRVFTLRITQKRSPFQADRQHIHHRLLDLGYSHVKSTVILLLINIGIIALSIWLQFIGNLSLVLVQLTIAFLLSSLLMYKVKHKTKMKNIRAIENQLICKDSAKCIDSENYPFRNEQGPFGYSRKKNSGAVKQQ